MSDPPLLLILIIGALLRLALIWHPADMVHRDLTHEISSR